MSVVGGVNLMFEPDISILLGTAKIPSPEGKSKLWDANANGYARGEGFGVTILKPLDTASRDGDNIRAVVLAQETNADKIYGIGLRDVSIDTALHVPDTEKSIEVMTQLHNRRTVRTISMQYGPTFRNMTELYAGPNASHGVMKVPDIKSIMPKGFGLPTTISGEDQALNEAVVPRSFDRIFVPVNIPMTAGAERHGCSSAKKLSYTTWNSNITMSEATMAEPVVIMKGVTLASVGATEDTSKQVETRASCFWQNWHVDADLLTPSQIKEIIYRRTLKSKDDDSVLDLLEFVCLSEEGKAHVPQDGFWKSYVEWMHDTVKELPLLPADIESKMEKAW
ncbi:hypothetical protein G6011_05433 [Alternaria panax]|uniref:Beta-ketoacyl synthase-like N-terminal domain-containing protein n=1 Tax=Alternaria panax TaxID=48097 RepID=A0AAD4FD03_9PLEO|nr:hypothetical protein G6011_05433 [Alternaria panax]